MFYFSFPLVRFKFYSTGRSYGKQVLKHRFSSAIKKFSFIEPLIFTEAIGYVSNIIKRKGKPDLFISVFLNGFLSSELKAENLEKGDFVLTSNNPLPVIDGNTMQLKHIPVGLTVFNLGSIAKSAGTFIQILRHKLDYTLCKLPSRELKWFKNTTLATIGKLGNADSKFFKLYKAGQKKYLGRRPITRGVAMNPIDHPHGGGQGKTSGGRPSVTPYARLTKGFRTKRKKFKNLNIFKYAKQV